MRSFVVADIANTVMTVCPKVKVGIVLLVKPITNKEINEMPHIKDEIKVALNTTDRQVVEMGDACWLFADYALKKYNEEPRWRTIHQIKVALRNPYHDGDTHSIIRAKMGHMSKADIEAAAELAFLEFYRLVGSAYEDVKAIENGNCFAGAKVPTPKVEVQDVQPTETPVPTLQGEEVPAPRRVGRPRKMDSGS